MKKNAQHSPNPWNTSGKKTSHSTKCLHKEIERCHASKLATYMKTLAQKEPNTTKSNELQEINSRLKFIK